MAMFTIDFSKLRKRHIAALAAAIALTVATFLTPFNNDAGSHEAQQRGIIVDHPFAYETIGNQTVGAAFMTILNETGQADRLVGASSEVAGRIEIHTHRLDPETGIMRMRRLPDGLEIPANSKVQLKPGHNHLMMFGLKEAFVTGIHMPITLMFEKAGAVETTLAIESRDAGHSMGSDEQSHHGGHGHH